MHLIIIEGQTSTGKSTLAKRLSADLGVEYVQKDAYKERVFDGLAKVPNLLQWQRIEIQSWQHMYAEIRRAQNESMPLIIEGNFGGNQRRKIRKLLHTGDTVTEIYCHAKPQIILQRYIRRNKTGERHPGHRDKLWYWVVWVEGTCARLGWHWIKPLQLTDRLLSVDTTDFGALDYSKIRKFIAG